MTNSYIECRRLNKQFRSRNKITDALTDINLNIEKGQMVLLKGRSGAGKSTLLNILGGLLSPSSGSVKIDDLIISELNNNEICEILLNKTGIIFQSFNLLPTYNVYENVEIALAPRGLNDSDIQKLIMPYFEEFHLADRLHLLPDELSVGQQQRVAIIRTLVKQPSLILADEPTASVDEETAGEILHHLKNLKESKGVTVIIATHGVIPDAFADRIIVLEDGHIA